MKKGKLIVLDGADGSGKATQAKILVTRLKKEGYKVKTLDFPQYKKNFFGKFIGECLSGKHGDFLGLNPYVASIVYDCDRFESRDTLVGFLKQGYTIVLDRYVTANQIHQGGKIADSRQRKKFLVWLEKMDFDVFRLPRADLTLYLDVPYVVSAGLLSEKGGRLKKTYLGKGRKDQAEGNPAHQKSSRTHALRLIDPKKHFLRVNCVEDGTLLSREEIAEQIWNEVRKII